MKNARLHRPLAIIALSFWSCAVTHAQETVNVIMVTSHGEIRIALDVKKAPITAANFLRYVDGKHYDGATFYRTVRYENDNGNPKI